jgi:hypothetical protein
MRRTRPATVFALATVLSTSLALAHPAAASAEARAVTCEGLPVTVEGVVGTEGDDVMLAPLNAWQQVEGLAGDDTICLVDGNAGSRDPAFFADAGPGDDVVVNQSRYGPTVHLGAGADRFIGNDLGASVYTGAYEQVPDTFSSFGQRDTEADVVLAGDGRSTIYSGDTWGYVPNPDRIATGGYDGDPDTVYYAGRMTPEGGLDNGSSRDLLYLAGSWAPGLLTIDNVAGRAELAGTELLRWSGVRAFTIPQRPQAVRFVGGPRSELLTIGDWQLAAPGAPMTVDIVTGGRRDHVTLAGALQGRIRLGGGRDDLLLGGACDSTRAVLGSHLLCRDGASRSRTELAGVDDIALRVPNVVAIGTAGPDTIYAYGDSPRVLGRGGPDVLDALGAGGVANGGAGRDTCSGETVRRCER